MFNHLSRTKLIFFLEISIAARAISTSFLLILIVAVSLVPGEPEPGDSVFIWLVAATPTILQKLMHVVVYALYAGFCYWTFERVEPGNFRLAIAISAACLTGAILEYCQLFIPGRFATLMDLQLNAAGSIVGALLAARLTKP